MSNEKVPRQTSLPTAQKASRQANALPLIAKSALATLLLVSAVATTGYALSRSWKIGAQGDELTPSEQQRRLEAFNALGYLPLSAVPKSDINHALDGMQLTPNAYGTLKANLTPAPAFAAKPLAAPNPAAALRPQPAAVAPALPLRLVWVTLWDTDVEDGDVVRIDSQGYSRTVKLTKKGTTFAVPVMANGVIQVTGVNDGDGGGITVGLASGSAKAIFPIMSEGQVLGLRATLK